MISSVAADVVPAKAGSSGSISARLKEVPAFAGTTLSALLLTACTSVQLPAGTAPLDPIAFFSGATAGEGKLDTLIASPVRVTVKSQGTPIPDGLRLVQVITEGAKAPRTRVWTIRKRGPADYGGTLTDAKGEVMMIGNGPYAYIGYSTPSGLVIQQQLALQPDGRTILNRLEAYKFGIRVAVLNETIRKPIAK